MPNYQMAGCDRVDKRQRLLTIPSVITLPLGIIAGLLGMIVGGVPGRLTNLNAFAAVVVSMIVLTAVELVLQTGWLVRLIQ